MLKTFLDTGVLIAATRGAGADQERALAILEDPGRAFIASAFLYLELVPKAVFNKRRLEKAFYDKYLQKAHWVRDVEKIVVLARAEAERAGLGAMDALHLAAAHLSGADEFVTTEKPAASIYRCSLVKVVYLYRQAV